MKCQDNKHAELLKDLNLEFEKSQDIAPLQFDDCSPIKQGGGGGEVKVSPFMLSPIDLKNIVIPEISNFAVLENSMVIESPCSNRSHRRISSGSFVTNNAMAGLNESELAAVKDMYEELVQIQE